jgi:hypothetical protein
VPDFQASLYYEVVNTAGISAIISSRFYPAGEVPQDADLPYMTFQRISNVQVRHQTANSALNQYRYQFECRAETEKGARDLREQLLTALDRFSGEMGESGSTNTIRDAFHDNDSMDFQPPTDASERGPHRAIVDILFWDAA